MGWAGGPGGGGNMPQVAGAQEVVITISGGLADAETGGVVINVIPRDGANTFSGQFNFSGSNDSLQGNNYTQRLKDLGPAVALRADLGVRRQPDVRRPDRPGQAVVLLDLPADRREEHGAGHVLEQERGRHHEVDRRLRPIEAGLHEQGGAPGDAPADVAGDAAQQVQRALVRAVPRLELRRGGRHRDGPVHDAGSDAAVVLHPVPSTARLMVVADLGPAAGRSGLGHVPGPVPLHETERRHRRSGDDSGPGTGRRVSEPPLARADSPREPGGSRTR